MNDLEPRRRILWLSHLLPWPPKGGLQQRSYYLMREVARHHDLRVIAFRQRAHQSDDTQFTAAKIAISEFAELSDVLELPQEAQYGGRNGLALRSLAPGLPYTIRWGLCRAYAAAVRHAIKTFQPHVVHFDTISLAHYLVLIGTTPGVLNHHNIESQMVLRRASQETNPLKRFYFWQEGRRLASYERTVAPKFALHLVCADLDAMRLEANVGPVPTEVVPNGVDLEYFRPAVDGTVQRPGSLVFVGGLSWYPNASAIRYFLRSVWPIIIARRPDVEFRIIGRNPPADIRQAATRDSRIKVMGFVDDIRPVVHGSMVYVCPIFDGGGTKLKMLDAMAMGKAIVAHPVACEGLEVTDGRQVLEAANPESFATKILRVLDEAELRASLEQNAREHVCDHFSFTTIGHALSRSYVRLGELSR